MNAPKPHNVAPNASPRTAHVVQKSSKPAQSKSEEHRTEPQHRTPTPARTLLSDSKSEGANVTPQTSHRLQPSAKFAHWTKAKEIRAPGSSSSFRGASASQNIRKSLSESGDKIDEQVKQDLSKRLAQFVRTIPPASLEATTTKQAKSAVMHYFDDFGSVWKKHKAFFKVSLGRRNTGPTSR